MGKIKYQTESITIANGTGAGTISETAIEVEKGYDKITGYSAHIISRTPAEKFRLGLTDRGGILHDRTFEDEHITSTGVNPNDRFKKLDTKAGGNQIRVQVENIDALTADLKLDVVFRLEKLNDCD